MAEAAARIVLVGHCGPDSYTLRSAVQRMVPGSVVEFANDEESLRAEIARADLLLVNRVLEGDYTLGMGVELVREVRSGGAARSAVMLVSNFADAQAEAEAAGAAPGFGKRDMSSEETRRRILAALGRG